MMIVSDFWMCFHRLTTNPHEYTSRNAITRIIAEYVGYRIEYRHKRGQSHFFDLTAPDGTIRTLTLRHSDIDRAWQEARMRKLIPDYMGDVNAALTLPIADTVHIELHRDSPGEWYALMLDLSINQAYSAPLPAHAYCAVWWLAFTGEIDNAALTS